MKRTLMAGCIALSLLPALASAADTQLNYPAGHADANIIPYPDNQLQTVQAELWQPITDDATLLEGPAFDGQGNLYLTDLYHGQIVKVDNQKNNTIVFHSKEYAPCSIAIRKDGKLVVAAVAFDGSKGKIFVMNPDGSDIQTIVATDKGFRPNDMVFDQHGGIYFTDASGDSGNPVGGVYYVSPDASSVTPILKNLSGGNGIALSPDGKTLWVVEFSAGVLHRLLMQDATHIRAFGENVAYRFNGLVADSMKADSDGNLYIALHGQGRVIVLNKNATPIGQITLAGREQGHNLRSTNLAIKPGTRELYITSSNDEALKTGGAVFKAYGFAPAIKQYWQQKSQ
ncbi:SMP-30/gluconolactonase/LRE family protein [Shewanella sp. C32]|uniref:SMP-30/gluconolactonase/LRE family protein n=1 Tax=Shewanella electrica TaxID=515560 RepID=A0ABT2FJE7_9GAMM|nr:SMP-30/gluconolactonase/LRE family protein [Shewanella electrica]MCH1924213.1 SMP-30/gluconolactonase/LRE family protein [Shewanella electrica]MCS4556116.1 SMP-30/gluconolactonase/LRE family protein [Shewanella electrica]